jgi:hypothetical protein
MEIGKSKEQDLTQRPQRKEHGEHREEFRENTASTKAEGVPARVEEAGLKDQRYI